LLAAGARWAMYRSSFLKLPLFRRDRGFISLDRAGAMPTASSNW
jgi:hypothetical protein